MQKIILSLLHSFFDVRKARAIETVKRTTFRWVIFYIALIFIIFAFGAGCFSLYFFLEPQLGGAMSALIVMMSTGGLGLCFILLGILVGRKPSVPPPSNPPVTQAIAEAGKECDFSKFELPKFVKDHGLEIVAGLFILGALCCGRKKKTTCSCKGCGSKDCCCK